ILDGTDNFATRYLIHDACFFLKKSLVYGSVSRFEGQVSTFVPAKGPCYRCLYLEPPSPETIPSCADGGVLGVVPGLVGLLQATEVLKLLLKQGEPLLGRVLLINALSASFKEMRLEKNP